MNHWKLGIKIMYNYLIKLLQKANMEKKQYKIIWMIEKLWEIINLKVNKNCTVWESGEKLIHIYLRNRIQS